ncbi:MAG TPA: glycoside hydrolase family 25 protein [Candidatus Dormibacteraeota bacterium]|nr:glycoside hydrolase family 25 protein [Candidatus Dormibacteraeota bacterium]
MALEGIDTSVFQGSPDWAAVRNSGREFAISKATEGVGFIDPTFGRNWSEMLRVGVPVPGAYHFARPDLGNTPEAEADFFLSVVQSVTGSVIGTLLALDIEVDPASAQWAAGFEARMRDRLSGYGAGFYSFFSWLGDHGVARFPQLAADWLWLAWPDANGPLPLPGPWPVVSIQQYGISTAVPGIVGAVDVNRFFGDLTALQRLSVGGPPVVESAGGLPMASGQCLFLNGVNHVFLLGSDGVIKWSAVNGGAGGILNVQQAYVNVPCFSTDIRDIWVSQDRGPARSDGSGDVIDRILLFAAFGDSTWAFCVLNPTDSSTKILDWTEPLPGMHLRARVPVYQGQVISNAVDTSTFATQTELDALRNRLHQV